MCGAGIACFREQMVGMGMGELNLAGISQPGRWCEFTPVSLTCSIRRQPGAERPTPHPHVAGGGRPVANPAHIGTYPTPNSPNTDPKHNGWCALHKEHQLPAAHGP